MVASAPRNRPPFSVLLAVGCVWFVACIVTAADARAETPVDFAREIRPILSEQCFHCHGPDAGVRQADLRLDTPDGAATMITAGDRHASELFRRLISSDPAELMPPPDSNRRLTPAQIESLGRWIDQGAPWQEHWAFSPLVRPELPGGAEEQASGAIDRFARAVWAAEGIEGSEPASPEARLRRVTLDLTGLPPTLEDLDAFLADPSKEAYERAVERLLQSPAFGERMAWDWLDAARYADSNGYQGDGERTMWPWRDWVVDAFNRNLPFDQFTLWQVAGDQLPDATFEQRLASGFFRNHMINGEGGRIAEENRIEYVFDMTETLGTVWLGLTLNCCRCHDHKFDPLTQADYYSLFAFFNQTPINGGGGNPQTPPVLEVPAESQRLEIDRLQQELAAVRERLAERSKALEAEQPAWEQEWLAKLDQPGAWKPLLPTAYAAEGQDFTLLEDGSLLSSGANPAQDSYRLTYRPGPMRATGIRLEALRHESMTAGGLARSDSGNFVLTGLEIVVRRPGAEPRKIEIASGEASFEQGGFGIGGVWDNDPSTGWAVYEGKPIDRDHQAVLRFSAPSDVIDGEEWVITLRHESPHAQHNIGRLRLAITEMPQPTLGEAQQESLAAALRMPPDARGDEERKLIRRSQRESDAAHREIAAEVDVVDKRLASVRGGIPKVMIMGDQPERRPTFILQVGAYTKPGAEVSAAVPGFLPDMSEGSPANRLGLARWLIDDRQPLMARVVVNRFWQSLFGIGLVKTPEDFGVQGEIPRHRELLDWLAADFRDSGCDVKRLLRQIVTSEVYQQSSRVTPETHERDPENRLLAHGPRRRLPAWMIRDQALAIGGLLVPKLGGQPVNGYQPAGIWEEATFGNKRYQQDTGEALYRRTLYTFWRRIVAPTMLFDNATRQTCTVSPFLTNTPLHALTTLNDTTYVEAARGMSQRVLAERARLLGANADGAVTAEASVLDAAAADRAALAWGFRLATARQPRDAEVEILLGRLAILREQFSAVADAANAFLAIGESPRDAAWEPGEQAAWAAVCSLILNLDETITKP